jgi:hypothetical protein
MRRANFAYDTNYPAEATSQRFPIATEVDPTEISLNRGTRGLSFGAFDRHDEPTTFHMLVAAPN